MNTVHLSESRSERQPSCRKWEAQKRGRGCYQMWLLSESTDRDHCGDSVAHAAVWAVIDRGIVRSPEAVLAAPVLAGNGQFSPEVGNRHV